MHFLAPLQVCIRGMKHTATAAFLANGSWQSSGLAFWMSRNRKVQYGMAADKLFLPVPSYNDVLAGSRVC